MRVLSFLFTALALCHAFTAPIVQRVSRGGGIEPLRASAKERTYIMVRTTSLEIPPKKARINSPTMYIIIL
jgi:hypothetical protein